MSIQKIIDFIGGCIGGLISFLFGGWDLALQTALLLMGADYITGFIKGIKTHSLRSELGVHGFLKKCCYVIILFLANQLDNLMGVHLIEHGCCYFFIINESLSIIENMGQMGVPIPQIISKYIKVLQTEIGDNHASKSNIKK